MKRADGNAVRILIRQSADQPETLREPVEAVSERVPGDERQPMRHPLGHLQAVVARMGIVRHLVDPTRELAAGFLELPE